MTPMAFFKQFLEKFSLKYNHQKETNTQPSEQQIPAEHPLDDFQRLQVLNDAVFEPAPPTSEELGSTLNNLRAMKKLISHESKTDLNIKHQEIKSRLGLPECHETIRQDRWNPSVYCPFCQSTNAKRIEKEDKQAKDKHDFNHYYLCLNCHQEFNDNTQTPFSQGVPPMHIWIQCWYLWGMTHSIPQIAHQLNLPVAVIEAMLRKIKSIFNSEEPLEKLYLDPEMNMKNQFTTSLKRQEERQKQAEYLNADVTYQAKDSHEQRRQKEKRMDPKNPKPV